jgi:hypothetical protein
MPLGIVIKVVVYGFPALLLLLGFLSNLNPFDPGSGWGLIYAAIALWVIELIAAGFGIHA